MKNAMRILAVDTIAVESARRSAYRALAQIQGCEVHLLVPKAWQEQGGVMYAEPEHDPALHLHTSRTLLEFRQHRVLFTGLARTLRELKPDLLYMDMEPENYAAAQGRLTIDRVSPRTRLALVSSRNLDYRSIGFPYKFSFTHRWCDNLAKRRPAEIMFVRPKSTMHLLEGYGRSIAYLPHPVDCELFSPYVPAAIPPEPDTFVAGYIGRLVESKGVHLLIRAIAKLPGHVRGLIVGRGPAREPLEALARDLGLSRRISFLSAVPYAEVPGIMRSMDVLVLPSLATTHWIEQFGRVLIEAMACGTPVVASRLGEIPEVLGGGGVLFEAGDQSALVARLTGLSANARECSGLASLGRQRAEEYFSAPVVARMMYSTFSSCL